MENRIAQIIIILLLVGTIGMEIYSFTHPNKLMLTATDPQTKEVKQVSLEDGLSWVVQQLSTNDQAIYNACVSSTKK